MKKILFLVAVFLGIGLVFVVGYLLSRDSINANDAVAGNEITYYDHGFSPPALRLPAGSQLTLKNESSKELQFSSDPYPGATNNPELNSDTILQPGQVQEIIIAHRGVWGYHNRLNPDHKGLIVVE